MANPVKLNMRRNFVIVLLMTALVWAGCASVNLKGMYFNDNLDDTSEDCFQYSFHNDGTFVYCYTNAVFGDFIVNGEYYVLEDKIKLFPVRYIFMDSAKVEYAPRRSADSIRVCILLLPGHFKNHPDTMRMPWLIKVNDQKFFAETDESGVYAVRTDSVSRVEIMEYSAKFQMDGEMPEADTVIYPLHPDMDMDIYLASQALAPFVIPPVSVFRIHRKGRLLESLDTCETGYWKHSTRFYIK